MAAPASYEVAPVSYEAAPVASSCSSCNGEVSAVSYEAAAAPVATDGGYNLAPGETLVPGSVQTVSEGTPAAAAPVESASDSGEEAPPAPVADEAPDA